MQKSINLTGPYGENAVLACRKVSRRTLLKGAVAGAAITVDVATAGRRPATAQTATIRPITYWEERFIRIWNTHHSAIYYPLSTSGASDSHYDLSYGVDGNLAMYQATGNTRYLDRALLYVNEVIATARPSYALGSRAFGDSYYGWISRRADTYGREIPLFESYLWRYVARLLYVMSRTGLATDSRYSEAYQNILSFIGRNILDKWNARSSRYYSFIYRENTHMASHWAYIAMYLGRVTQNIDRRTLCAEIADNVNTHLPNYIGRSLRGNLIRNPDALYDDCYFWAPAWGRTARPGSDTPHANGVVSYIVEAQRLGFEWTSTDTQMLSNTLRKVIWPSAGRYAEYVDGSGGQSGWFNDGWCKLGRYSVSLQIRLENHTIGRNLQFYGNLARNAKILESLGMA